MDKNLELPYLEVPALKVNQPLGAFYVINLRAEQLNALSFSEALYYKDEFGNVKGSQRDKDEKRLREIAKYIDSVEMAFPNSIILAANYTQQGTISKGELERWKLIEDANCGIYKIIIPKKVKLAAIIDGQHRLMAFQYVSNKARLDDLQLVCSVYFDLPNSYQAFLFATINSNQKRVARSLALEQFGFNVDEEPEKAWTPEKYAVFLSRKLNIERDSPFHKRIKVAPLNVENLFKDGVDVSWTVSTATIVDGILLLISSNPKRDRIEMQQKSILGGRSRSILEKFKDFSPLRNYFIQLKDQTIYNTLIRYFNAVQENLWVRAQENSYIIKTVGIQALFDILKLILKAEGYNTPEEIDYNGYLVHATGIDFSDRFFQASGIGRNRIKNTLAFAMGLISQEKLKQSDLPTINELVHFENSSNPPERLLWEEEAEKTIINTLDKAQWNYKNKSINLYLDSDYDNAVEVTTLTELRNRLLFIAESSFISYAPADIELRDKLVEDFDFEDLVETHLNQYDENIKLLGWKS